MWPSIVFQPASLVNVLRRSQAWRAASPPSPEPEPMPLAGTGLIDADQPVLD
jgi:hypothetical protein